MPGVWGKRHIQNIKIQKYIYKNIYIYIYKRERENRKSKQQKERGTTPQIGQTT